MITRQPLSRRLHSGDWNCSVKKNGEEECTENLCWDDRQTGKTCHILRNDGMSYGDYPSATRRAGVEQLARLLFIKMARGRKRRLV